MTGEAHGPVSPPPPCGGLPDVQGNTDLWLLDGTRTSRFLINTVLDEETATPVTFIQNWQPEAN